MSLLLKFIIVALAVCTCNVWAYTKRHYCHTVPDFCRNITNDPGYSEMRLPNELNHYQLNETVKEIGQWEMLVGNCHAGLKLFLCTIYAPICLFDPEGEPIVIKLCKPFCTRVKESCEPVMNRYNHPWPSHDAFNCSLYKDDKDDKDGNFCLKENIISARTTTTTQPPLPTGNDDICDPNLNTDDVLQRKACESHLAFRAEVSVMRDAKGSYTLLKLKKQGKKGTRTSRNSRKAKKTPDTPDRVLVPQSGCRDLYSWVKEGGTYLIILDKDDKRSGKRTKYIVKAIVPWNKRHRKVTRRNNCDRR